MTTRPVVALDLDDVINADRGDLHTIVIDAATWPTSPFLRRPTEATTEAGVRIDPAIGPWITELRTRADVVWATTWEHAANTYIAPLLGIDALPVPFTTTTHHPRFGHVKNRDAAAWKAEALTALYPGRPLVWVDDQAWAYLPQDPDEIPAGERWWDFRYQPPSRWDDEDEPRPTPAPTLVITPERPHGLTAEHRAIIDAFVADPYGYVEHVPAWMFEDQ